MDHKLNLGILVADGANWGPWINLAACTWLAGIRLFPELDRSPQDILLFSALFSTISSPDFHVVQLSFHEVSTDDLAQELVYPEVWERLAPEVISGDQKQPPGRHNPLSVFSFYPIAMIPCRGSKRWGRFGSTWLGTVRVGERDSEDSG
jgi:hypothetical protein